MIDIKINNIEEYPLQNLPFVANSTIIKSVFGKSLKQIHGLTGENILSIGSMYVSPLIQTLHLAFSNHYPVSLKPEVLWFTISSEVAKHIKYNADKYKELFNGDPNEKKIICAEDNSLVYGCEMDEWIPAIERYRPILSEHIPSETQDLFLPKLSTANQVSDLALLVSFMDAASPYYDYRMRTLCGIPRIRIEGEKKDWELLISKCLNMKKIFTELDEYFSNLVSVLDNFVCAFDNKIDDRFWSSIYKKGGGSGGPYVQGWITSIVAYKGKYLKRNFNWCNTFNCFGGLNVGDFPTNISKVDFIWEYLGQNIPMSFVGGVLDVVNNEGFLTPQLGVGIVERQEQEKDLDLDL